MNLFINFPNLITVLADLRYLNKYKKGILKAKSVGDKESEREYILKATSTWGKQLAKDFKVDLIVTGKENLPQKGPVVYISNHQGYGDIICLCAALDSIQFAFVARDNLEKVPFYGKWIKLIRSVLINRGNPREAIKAISQGIANINEGFSMLIFPEGTRSQGPDMSKFKPGAFKLATKPKVPIVPVTLNGTWRMFEEHGKIMPSKVQIHIHPAIETINIDKEEERALPNLISGIIEKKLKELQAL